MLTNFLYNANISCIFQTKQATSIMYTVVCVMDLNPGSYELGAAVVQKERWYLTGNQADGMMFWYQTDWMEVVLYVIKKHLL